MSIVNPSDIKLLLKTDPIFKLIKERYGIPPNWSRPPGFISLCKIILEQQVSLASANAHFKKLNSYISGFTPSNILLLTDEEMRTCQVSRQKTVYLRSLSSAIINKDIDLDSLPQLSEAAIREQLTSIKGIGVWTSDIYLMFCLQQKDIFPLGDIAAINTIKELSGAITREDIILLSEKWKPVRSLATYFLWHYYLKKRNRPAEYV
jgi:DNA-3-methyladenine glycosylase II